MGGAALSRRHAAACGTVLTASPYPIVPAGVEHLDGLCALEHEASPYPWSRREFGASLAAHAGFVMLRRHRVIGFIFYHRVLDEAELLNIAISPSFQGEGLGHRLLNFGFEQLGAGIRRMFLEVRATNFAALALYENNGFTQIGTRLGYYHDAAGSEDALVMCRDFGATAHGSGGGGI